MNVLVIGGGVSGLSTAYHLKRAGHNAVVLEGRDRIGGRAWTNRDFTDFPVEFGAEMVHGHGVSTWEWITKLGLKTYHWAQLDDTLVRMSDGRQLTMKKAMETSNEFKVARMLEMEYPPPPAPVGDEDLQSYLERVGFTQAQVEYVRRMDGNSWGDDISRLSAEAVLLELNGTEASTQEGLHPLAWDDYRILDGYDSFYNNLVEGIDVRLKTVVKSIRWEDKQSGVTVEVEDGRTFDGDCAVITLPLAVLDSSDIKFSPSLPDIKIEAFSGLDMPPALKLIYVFDQPIMEEHIAGIYSTGNPPKWWQPSFSRDTKATVWTGFCTGDYARSLMAMGEDNALEHGLNTLRKEAGRSDLTPCRARWVCLPLDPLTRGGYSVTRPGHASAREKLARPTPPLFWAGEATAEHHEVATVHGAYNSGKRAVNDILCYFDRLETCGNPNKCESG